MGAPEFSFPATVLKRSASETANSIAERRSALLGFLASIGNRAFSNGETLAFPASVAAAAGGVGSVFDTYQSLAPQTIGLQNDAVVAKCKTTSEVVLLANNTAATVKVAAIAKPAIGKGTDGFKTGQAYITGYTTLHGVRVIAVTISRIGNDSFVIARTTAGDSVDMTFVAGSVIYQAGTVAKGTSNYQAYPYTQYYQITAGELIEFARLTYDLFSAWAMTAGTILLDVGQAVDIIKMASVGGTDFGAAPPILAVPTNSFVDFLVTGDGVSPGPGWCTASVLNGTAHWCTVCRYDATNLRPIYGLPLATALTDASNAVVEPHFLDSILYGLSYNLVNFADENHLTGRIPGLYDMSIVPYMGIGMYGRGSNASWTQGELQHWFIAMMYRIISQFGVNLGTPMGVLRSTNELFVGGSMSPFAVLSTNYAAGALSIELDPTVYLPDGSRPLLQDINFPLTGTAIIKGRNAAGVFGPGQPTNADTMSVETTPTLSEVRSADTLGLTYAEETITFTRARNSNVLTLGAALGANYARGSLVWLTPTPGSNNFEQGSTYNSIETIMSLMGQVAATLGNVVIRP